MWVYKSQLVAGGGGVVLGSLGPAEGFLSLLSFRPSPGHWPGPLQRNPSFRHSIIIQFLEYKAWLNTKQNKDILWIKCIWDEKLVPTFCWPSLCFRRLGVCLDLDTFFSVNLGLSLLLGLSFFLWPSFGPGFDPRLCVGLRLPGAPGFPCETNYFAIRAWHKPLCN